MHDFRYVQILKITSHECLSRLDPKFENLILDKAIRYCWLMLVVSPYPVSHSTYPHVWLQTSVFGSNPQILDNGLLKSLFVVEIPIRLVRTSKIMSNPKFMVANPHPHRTLGSATSFPSASAAASASFIFFCTGMGKPAPPGKSVGFVGSSH